MGTERKDIKYQLSKGYKLQTLMHKVNKETLKRTTQETATRKSQWYRPND